MSKLKGKATTSWGLGGRKCSYLVVVDDVCLNGLATFPLFTTVGSCAQTQYQSIYVSEKSQFFFSPFS